MQVKRSVRAKKKNLSFLMPKNIAPRESSQLRGSRTPESVRILLSRGRFIIHKCEWCNKTFIHYLDRRFCSLQCFWKWSSNNPQGNLYKGRISRYPQKPHIFVNCYICKKPIEIKSQDKSRRKYFTCSIKCVYKLRATFSGSKCSGWKGGISFDPYPLGWKDTFKEQIRYRDRYKCQLCGAPEIENLKKLHVHHIDYKKENLRITNLISLCNPCHGKTNSNRKYWIKYFSQRKERVCEHGNPRSYPHISRKTYTSQKTPGAYQN